MKLIHLTDLHLMPPGQRLWGLDPFERLDLCLRDIERHHPDASFCVVTGDLADRGEIEAYELLRTRIGAFGLDCHLILGNHDDRENFSRTFADRPHDEAGFIQFSVERNGRVFLFLDTLKGPPSSAGRYCPDRRKWLSGRLAEHAGKPLYIFMHHPPFEIGHPLMDKIMLEEPDAFADLLTGSDVRHIFFGHGHRAVSGAWNGIGFSALPSTNHQLPLVEGSVETVYSDEPPAYAVVTITNHGIVVHNDAYMHRSPALMPRDAERGNWV